MSKDPFDGVTWYDIHDFGLSGLAWQDEAREMPYDRFPATLKEKISPELWNLATRPAGVYVEFEGPVVDLYVRWTLEGDNNMEGYMAPVGRSGLDCYGRADDGNWRWVGCQEAWDAPNCNGRIHRAPLDGRHRAYRIYLPLMVRTSKCEIGSREKLTACTPDVPPRPPIARARALRCSSCSSSGFQPSSLTSQPSAPWPRCRAA